jgi:diguanylate cyclase (GGDEF)-like protein
MIRVLMALDTAEAELALTSLRSKALKCEGECVVTERDLHTALVRRPDLILFDIELTALGGGNTLTAVRSHHPNIPVIVFSRTPQSVSALAREQGVAACVPKSNVAAFLTAIQKVLEPRTALDRNASVAHRASDREQLTGRAPSESASYLLERKASLERMLHRDDGSLTGVLTRSPPLPAALVMIQDAQVRERYLKVLHHAGIEAEIAADVMDGTLQLSSRTHAALFTDALDLIRAVRDLSAGAATHVVFVSPHPNAASEALQAGANDIMPQEARGEHFWPRLSLVRRIVSFASSLQSAVTHNRILATLDELTRCGNRRYFEHQFSQEVARAIRLRRPLALLMCDIDHFKAVNDQHGHQVGDEVLRETGDRLTHGLRLGEDWVARVGGEEFAIVLPETGPIKALAVADRLRARVSTQPFETSVGPLPVTASLGICAVQSATHHLTDLRERMIALADAALYRSKREGRNRVSASQPLEGALEPEP